MTPEKSPDCIQASVFAAAAACVYALPLPTALICVESIKTSLTFFHLINILVIIIIVPKLSFVKPFLKKSYRSYLNPVLRDHIAIIIKLISHYKRKRWSFV